MPSITLQTSKVTFDPGAPRIIVFQFKKPFVAPIYLSVLTLIENPNLTGISGAIIPGDSTNPGTCDLQMPTALFTSCWDYAHTHAKPNVTLTYNDTNFNVTDVQLTPASAAPVVNAVLGGSPADAS